MRAVVIVATVSFATGALVFGPNAGPAGADGGSAGAGSGGGTVTVGAGSGSGTGGTPGAPGTPSGPSGGGGTGSPWECTSTYLTLNNEGGFPPGGPTPGAWYSVTCDDTQTGAQVTQTVWLTSGQATPVPAVDPRTLALQAEQSMRLPDPAIGLDPAGTTVVGLATWLWVEPSIWTVRSVTASAGSVSATAVARPVGVTWTTGDGGEVTCGGPGTVYDPTRPSTWQSTYCSHTYSRTSLGQPTPDGDPDDGQYTVQATVEWAVTWSAVGAPGGGSLPTLYTTGSAGLRVAQIESLDTAPAGGGPGWPGDDGAGS